MLLSHLHKIHKTRLVPCSPLAKDTTLHQDTFLLYLSTVILIIKNISLINNINDVNPPHVVQNSPEYIINYNTVDKT